MIETIIVLCFTFLVNADHTRDFELEKMKCASVGKSIEIQLTKEQYNNKTIDLNISENNLRVRKLDFLQDCKSYSHDDIQWLLKMVE
jgi:hypothetical protein